MSNVIFLESITCTLMVPLYFHSGIIYNLSVCTSMCKITVFTLSIRYFLFQHLCNYKVETSPKHHMS